MLAAARFKAVPPTLLAALSAGAYTYYQSTQTFAAQAEAAAAPAGALNPKEFTAFKLTEKEKLTHNTFRFRFELPDNQTAGLFTASCLVTRALLKEKPEDAAPKPIVRPYTPVSSSDSKGYLDLVVKVYPQGLMSKHFGELKIGDSLEMKGPIPKYPYQPNMKKKIGMIAGGSGITPMLQVVDTILANPEDKTEVSLIFANMTEDDIILKSKIDGQAAKHKNFKVFYLVDKPSEGGNWKGGVGHVNKDVLKQHMPPPSKDNIVFVCGPPGLMKAVSGAKAPDYSQGEVDGLLKELGYDTSNVFKF